MQLGSVDAIEISGLAGEGLAGVGNVRGAVSIFDGPDAAPTLVILLTDSHQLDDRYTPVGWVEAGIDVIESLSQLPAGGDGVPTTALSVGPLSRVDPDAPPVIGTEDAGSVPTPAAPIVLMIIAAAATAAVGLTHRRLEPGVVTTLLLASTLIGFFAAWTAAIGHTVGRPYAAVVLFVLAIGIFRLMGRFEQPRERTPDRQS